jgi:GxxExxY protein
MDINDITSEIINAAIKVHKVMGPGLFESVYEEVLAYELTKRGFKAERQVDVPVYYEDVKMDVGFRVDLFVNNEVIVEIKSVEKIIPLNKKQILNYIRLTGLQVGLLINFNEELLKDGLTRLINNRFGLQ